jgi:hypothetical protein
MNAGLREDADDNMAVFHFHFHVVGVEPHATDGYLAVQAINVFHAQRIRFMPETRDYRPDGRELRQGPRQERAPILECPSDRNGNPGDHQYYPGYQLVNSACPALGIPTPQTMLQFGDVLRQRSILAASAFREIYDTRTGEIQFPANRRELPGFLPNGSPPDFFEFPAIG